MLLALPMASIGATASSTCLTLRAFSLGGIVYKGTYTYTQETKQVNHKAT